MLGIVPGRRPEPLLTLRNAHGWGPSIWSRLLRERGVAESWIFADAALDELWKSIESQPAWQQIPNVLTFDTGVIPRQAFVDAADMLDEFERRIPAPVDHVNHVPAVERRPAPLEHHRAQPRRQPRAHRTVRSSRYRPAVGLG